MESSSFSSPLGLRRRRLRRSLRVSDGEADPLAGQPAPHRALDGERDLVGIRDGSELLAELLDGRLVLGDRGEEAAFDRARHDIDERRRDDGAERGADEGRPERDAERCGECRAQTHREDTGDPARDGAGQDPGEDGAAAPEIVANESHARGDWRERERGQGEEARGRSA